MLSLLEVVPGGVIPDEAFGPYSREYLARLLTAIVSPTGLVPGGVPFGFVRVRGLDTVSEDWKQGRVFALQFTHPCDGMSYCYHIMSRGDALNWSVECWSRRRDRFLPTLEQRGCGWMSFNEVYTGTWSMGPVRR